MTRNKIIIFTTRQCRNCPTTKHVVTTQAGKFQVPYEVRDITDDATEAREKYGVQAVPTVVTVTPDGQVVDRMTGVQSLPITVEFVRRAAGE